MSKGDRLTWVKSRTRYSVSVGSSRDLIRYRIITETLRLRLPPWGLRGARGGNSATNHFPAQAQPLALVSTMARFFDRFPGSGEEGKNGSMACPDGSPPDKVESLSSRFAPFSLILLPQFSLLFLFLYLNHCFGFCMSLIVGT